MEAREIAPCGKCEVLYFPGEDVEETTRYGVVCSRCAEQVSTFLVA